MIPPASSRTKMISNLTLTEDALIEIFLLLPLVSILKMRCVCKVFNYILTNPYFIRQWIQLNCRDQSLPWSLYYNYYDVPDNISMRFLITQPKSPRRSRSRSLRPRFFATEHGFSFRFLKFLNRVTGPKELHLIGSSKGLVLCSSSSDSIPTQYYVCNPVTKQWVTLPLAASGAEAVSGIACELDSSGGCVYQVVRIPTFKDNARKFKIEIFSSDVGKWKVNSVWRHKDVVGCCSSVSNIVIVGDTLYWIECGKLVVYSLNRNNVDTSCQKCRMIDLPVVESKNSDGERGNYCLGESEGFLCYAEILENQESGVWVFEEEWGLLKKNMDLRWLIGVMFGKFNKNKCKDPYGEETTAFYEEENKAIYDVQVLGFNPMNKSIILLSYDYGVWAYNIGTSKFEELVEPKFAAKMHKYYKFLDDSKAPYVDNPFIMRAMATILPPPSWEITSDQPGHGQPPDVELVASAGQMPYGETQYPSDQIIGGPSVGSFKSHGQTVGFSTSEAQLVQHQQQQPQSENQLQTDFKNHSLPLARIKKIMKANEDVKRIASEVPIILAKACELFMSDLTLRSWNHTEENKRRTLRKNDIAAAIKESDIFDFLAEN